MAKEYTPKQMQYIDSVDGLAHQSAVDIIGELEAIIKSITEFNTCPECGVTYLTRCGGCWIKELQAELTAKDDVLRKIKDWCRAYPLEAFPKPDKEYFAKAHAILKQNELSLTRISADNMRHVLKGIQEIIKGEAKDGEEVKRPG